MSWFGEDKDVENGNSCYAGFGSSGSCYGCPHESDCPYGMGSQTDDHRLFDEDDNNEDMEAFEGNEPIVSDGVPLFPNIKDTGYYIKDENGNLVKVNGRP